MKKVLIPVIAGMTIASMAVAQQATPKLDKRPDVQVRKFEMFCGPSSYLGVYPADVTDENAKGLGMSETYGALLTDVVDSSPARAVGLQKNDVIISWNGTRVESAAALRRLVIETPVGRSVHIGYVRGGVRKEIDTKIGNRPSPMAGMNMEMPEGLFQGQGLNEMMKMAPNVEQIFMKADDPRTGMTLQTTTPQLAKYFGIADGTGALIGAVEENSSAAKAGLVAGDVVVAVDGQKIQSPMDAHKIIGPKKEGTVDVTVIRDKKEQTFTVKLEGKPFDANFPGFENFNQLRGPMEIFRSFPNGEGSINEDDDNDVVAPPDGGSHPELSQKELEMRRDGNTIVRSRIRVIPAPDHEVRTEVPPSGL